jgi:hypothetical protein
LKCCQEQGATLISSTLELIYSRDIYQSILHVAYKQHCFAWAPVILGFTPAGPLELLNAKKFFKLQTVHSVFLGCCLFDVLTQIDSQGKL